MAVAEASLLDWLSNFLLTYGTCLELSGLESIFPGLAIVFAMGLACRPWLGKQRNLAFLLR